MNQQLTTTAKELAAEIIDFSNQLDAQMETWAEDIARSPDSPNKGVSAGFITTPTEHATIDLIVDILAPPSDNSAKLRTWVIGETLDDKGNERFNNVSLNFTVNYDAARQLVTQEQPINREDISKLLQAPESTLESIIVSDLTGRDVETDELLGKRHDLDTQSLNNLTDDERSNLLDISRVVFERLKNSIQE